MPNTKKGSVMKNTDDTKLAPCPFCGRKARLTPVDDGRFYFVSVNHKKSCYLFDMDALYYYANDKLKLVSEWNRRA